ncbi:AAA family ATPase [Micromonospora sp. RHAY321]|uniref:AAA family ATPase n=1 Tax=Micromonospora sp. RHAY321 TaxID=2944807 RepID=UPI00207D3A7A|nr:AAA family ATPase [Micromonospora sp. RHAY321]MCO1593550.1 AAA family ATPase [Micromonospora sp. RHAY321]
MTDHRRYVLTGAPGAGKTTLVEALRRRGHLVVREAATDIIAARQAQGCSEPWREPGFVDAVARLQHRRRITADPRGTLQIHDRSPLCTLALARHLGQRVGPYLAAELERISRQGTYQEAVFLIGPLGFVTHTAARRIGYAESLVFAQVHEQVYEAYGHRLVDVPAGPVRERVAVVEEHLLRPS